jgi:hypothetical protein
MIDAAESASRGKRFRDAIAAVSLIDTKGSPLNPQVNGVGCVGVTLKRVAAKTQSENITRTFP